MLLPLKNSTFFPHLLGFNSNLFLYSPHSALILTWSPLLKLFFEISSDIAFEFFMFTTGTSNIESDHFVI